MMRKVTRLSKFWNLGKEYKTAMMIVIMNKKRLRGNLNTRSWIGGKKATMMNTGQHVC